MSKKYEKKKLTGREFVDSAKEFCSYTISRCMQLPEEWKTYLLDPLEKDVSEIERLVLMSNRVYVNPEKQDQEEFIQSCKKRDDFLTESLLYFDDFGIKFDRLMSFIDVSGHEMNRLKNEILDLVLKEKSENPDIKDVRIKLVAHKDCIEYRAVSGSVFESLKLNSKNRDHWLTLREDAEEWIRKRITWDKTAIKRLLESR